MSLFNRRARPPEQKAPTMYFKRFHLLVLSLTLFPACTTGSPNEPGHNGESETSSGADEPDTTTTDGSDTTTSGDSSDTTTSDGDSDTTTSSDDTDTGTSDQSDTDGVSTDTDDENTPPEPEVRTISHPGAPLSLSDLETLKTKIDEGRQPWKSGFDLLSEDGKAQHTYIMAGPFETVGRSPDENLWPWRNDMIAIWKLSLMWYFTEDDRYAETARDILLAWATTQTEFSGRESMLDLGDYAYMFVGGADILRGTWPKWSEEDTASVKKYFNDVLMPASNPYGEIQYGAANKGALALVALGLMAIYNDDVEKLDEVVYQTRTLAHIGLRSSNDIGMLGDYLRDQGHSYGQLRSLVMLAEALWKQGIDIYSDLDHRLLAAGEYFARVNELIPTTALPFGTTDRYYTSDVTNRGWRGWGGGNIGLFQVHGAYAVRQGLQTPFIDQRMRWMPVDGDSFMFLKDTDSSTALPPQELSIPATASITTGFTGLDIGGASPTGSATYDADSDTWVVQGAGTDIWKDKDSCFFAYKALHGNSAIIAKVESTQDTSPAAKAGVMIRTDLAEGAPRAWMALTASGNLEQNMQGLVVYGGSNYGNKVLAEGMSSYWVKLERIGNAITGFVSPDGTNWAATNVGRIDAPVPDTVYVGLVVTASSPTDQELTNTSIFSSVQITDGDGAAAISVPLPPAVVLASPGDGSVPLRWQASFGATSYSVHRSTSETGDFITVASDVTGRSYTDETADNGVSYYYAITASNSAGTSELSPLDSATPQRSLVNVATGGEAYDGETLSSDNAAEAFDGNSATEWFHSGVIGTLTYDLGVAQVVEQYTVVSSFDREGRDAKNWEFLASNDNVSWTTLDVQNDQSFVERYELKSYTIESPESYRYYRLNVTANNGDEAFLTLGELGLLAPETE